MYDAHFLPEDFADDPYFRLWVQNPLPESEAFWQDWLAQHPEKRSVVEEARQLVQFLQITPVLPSRAEHHQVKAITQKKIRATSPAPPLRKRYRSLAYLQWAAAALLLISIAFFFTGRSTETIYVTRFGEIKTITLPDSSTVTLNANSSLRYTAHWQTDQTREVWLTGEAFFHVQRKPGWQPARFVVHSNQLNVEVLGTVFNVNNRRGVVKVVLNSGKVSLQPTDSRQPAIWMQPKEMVEFTPASQVFTKKNVNPETYSSWRQRKLIFNETPLREVAQVLEDTYGVKVRFSDEPLANRRFTGAVPSRNVDVLLTVLAESFDLRIRRENHTIRIETKR